MIDTEGKGSGARKGFQSIVGNIALVADGQIHRNTEHRNACRACDGIPCLLECVCRIVGEGRAEQIRAAETLQCAVKCVSQPYFAQRSEWVYRSFDGRIHSKDTDL